MPSIDTEVDARETDAVPSLRGRSGVEEVGRGPMSTPGGKCEHMLLFIMPVGSSSNLTCCCLFEFEFELHMLEMLRKVIGGR